MIFTLLFNFFIRSFLLSSVVFMFFLCDFMPIKNRGRLNFISVSCFVKKIVSKLFHGATANRLEKGALCRGGAFEILQSFEKTFEFQFLESSY